MPSSAKPAVTRPNRIRLKSDLRTAKLHKNSFAWPAGSGRRGLGRHVILMKERNRRLPVTEAHRIMETIDLVLNETRAEVHFNRPEILNAANCQWMDDLHETLDKMEAADRLRVVIFSGRGR